MIAQLSAATRISPRELIWCVEHEPEVFDELCSLQSKEASTGRRGKLRDEANRKYGG